MRLMCIECWEGAGSPTERTPQTARLVKLIDDLYAIHAAGGPLHSVLDDWNLDGVIEPYWDAFDDDELDALYDEGWAIADLPPEAPAVVEGLGVSTRTLCVEIAALLNGMTETQRRAALAYHEGFTDQALA